MPSSYTTNIGDGFIQIEHRMGFTIVKSDRPSNILPLFCNLCELSMNSALDKVYHDKYMCCSSCGIKWADLNQDKWIVGWRPDKEEIEDEINRRTSVSVYFSS